MKHPRGNEDAAAPAHRSRLRTAVVVAGVGAAVLTPLLLFPDLAGASPVRAQSIAHLSHPAARLHMGPKV